MLRYVVIAAALCITAVTAEDGGAVIPSNKTACIKKMLNWCMGMSYPKEGAGMTMISLNIQDQTGRYRVFCASDSDGTNCTKNGAPWFACSSNNELYYKGKMLTNSSTELDVDGEICNTTDSAFNDLYVQNMAPGNATIQTAFQKDMEAFFQQMATMQAQIEAIQNQIMNHFVWDGDSNSTNTPSPNATVPGNSQSNNTTNRK